uniref:BHLH domain-containing protein n=1 Tax=Mesocestoides corti TaxID=53468 RepID=A0A5K3EQS5_MESCO
MQSLNVKRRGPKSTLPREQREANRKIKKQNMERRRRACITERMIVLHDLAMSLIGENVS